MFELLLSKIPCMIITKSIKTIHILTQLVDINIVKQNQIEYKKLAYPCSTYFLQVVYMVNKRKLTNISK